MNIIEESASEARTAQVSTDAPVLFGATGDLAHKKVFPALQAMAKRGRGTFYDRTGAVRYVVENHLLEGTGSSGHGGAIE